jgi:hypothetical protein
MKYNNYKVHYGSDSWAVQADSHDEAVLHIVESNPVLNHFFEKGKILYRFEDFVNARVAVYTSGNKEPGWMFLKKKAKYTDLDRTILEATLRGQINRALDTGDKVKFMELTKQLNDLLILN